MRTSTLITNKTLIATEVIDLIDRPSMFYEKWIRFSLNESLISDIKKIKFEYKSPLDYLNSYQINSKTIIKIKEDEGITIKIDKYNPEETIEVVEEDDEEIDGFFDGILIIGTLSHEFYTNKVFSNEYIHKITTEDRFDERYRILVLPEYTFFEFKNNGVKKFFFGINYIYPTLG